VIGLHFSFGVTILVVMAIRFVHRLLYPVPLEASAAPAWERLLARTVHRLIYLILLVAPVLGWASASAHRLAVRPFGLAELPAIAAPKAHWALVAGDIHMLAMWTLLALVGLHVAGALFHHFVRHDDTLRRMLPSAS
jgi:cytochrome b561